MVATSFRRIVGVLIAMMVAAAVLVIPVQATPSPQGYPEDAPAGQSFNFTSPSSDGMAAVNCHVGARAPWKNNPNSVFGHHFTQCDQAVRRMSIAVTLWKWAPARNAWVVVGRDSGENFRHHQLEVFVRGLGCGNNALKYYTTTARHTVTHFGGHTDHADIRSGTAQLACNVGRI
jgi:hypothetical protein